MDIKQLGGKYAIVDGKPVAVWLANEDGELLLYLLERAGYADLEKLVENNQAV